MKIVKLKMKLKIVKLKLKMKLKIVKLKMKIKNENENMKYIFVKTLSIKFLSDLNKYIYHYKEEMLFNNLLC